MWAVGSSLHLMLFRKVFFVVYFRIFLLNVMSISIFLYYNHDSSKFESKRLNIYRLGHSVAHGKKIFRICGNYFSLCIFYFILLIFLFVAENLTKIWLKTREIHTHKRRIRKIKAPLIIFSIIEFCFVHVFCAFKKIVV